MTQPLTAHDVHDIIWAHTIDIASVAVAGKGSVRITASLTPNSGGSIRPVYKVTTNLDCGGDSKVTHFKQRDLDQAVTFYNSIARWL